MFLEQGPELRICKIALEVSKESTTRHVQITQCNTNTSLPCSDLLEQVVMLPSPTLSTHLILPADWGSLLKCEYHVLYYIYVQSLSAVFDPQQPGRLHTSTLAQAISLDATIHEQRSWIHEANTCHMWDNWGVTGCYWWETSLNDSPTCGTKEEDVSSLCPSSLRPVVPQWRWTVKLHAC